MLGEAKEAAAELREALAQSCARNTQLQLQLDEAAAAARQAAEQQQQQQQQQQQPPKKQEGARRDAQLLVGGICDACSGAAALRATCRQPLGSELMSRR